MDAYRVLEIFLDRVGLHASTTSAWLLDPRFRDLLEEGDQDLAHQARTLFEDLGHGSPVWKPLRQHLRELGADEWPP